MNQEAINLLNESFNVSSEDISVLLDSIQTLIREYERQHRLMEGLSPTSPDFAATLASFTPFMTATTALGVLDAYSDLESDTTLLQQEVARLRSLLRYHQQQMQRFTSTRTAAARKILPTPAISPNPTSGESVSTVKQTITAAISNLSSNIDSSSASRANPPTPRSELTVGANVTISPNVEIESNIVSAIQSPTPRGGASSQSTTNVLPEDLLNSPNTAATLATDDKPQSTNPTANLAMLESFQQTLSTLAANENNLEFLKKYQELGAYLNDETAKARKRHTEHERREVMKAANTTALSGIEGLDPQVKRRTWHASVQGTGAPSAEVELVDPATFQFRQQKASAEAKQKSMTDFCDGPLERSSSSGLNLPCLPPRGTVPSWTSLQQRYHLLHHPTVDLKKLNLLDLQTIPAAYIGPNVVAELAAGAGPRAEVAARLDQRLIARHLREQDPNSIALAENHPEGSIQQFKQSFCQEALAMKAGNFEKTFNPVQHYPKLNPLWEDPILPKPKPIKPSVTFEPNERPTTPHGSPIINSYPPLPYTVPNLPKCHECIPNTFSPIKPPPGFPPIYTCNNSPTSDDNINANLANANLPTHGVDDTSVFSSANTKNGYKPHGGNQHSLGKGRGSLFQQHHSPTSSRSATPTLSHSFTHTNTPSPPKNIKSKGDGTEVREEGFSPSVENKFEQLKITPNYIQTFASEYSLPPSWKGNEIGEEIELPRVVHGRIFKRPVDIIIDRKAKGNLIGTTFFPKHPKPFTTLIPNYEVLLPWQGEGHPYSFNRYIELDFYINGIGWTKARFGVCPPLGNGIILGGTYCFQHKVTYSKSGNIEAVHINNKKITCEICTSAYERLSKKK